MGMLSAFTYTMHVPNLSKPDHIMAVLEETDIFTKQEMSMIAKKLQGQKYVKNVRKSSLILPLKQFKNMFCLNSPSKQCRIFVGIKKLHGIIDMARQTEQQYRVTKFLLKLEEEGGLDTGTSIHQ